MAFLKPSTTTASKLRSGDKISVIAPSSSLSKKDDKDAIERAEKALAKLDLGVEYGSNVWKNIPPFMSNTIEKRVEDINWAFSNSTKGVLIASGGFNQNQILDQVDYELIKNRPKVICGFSDNTVLLNAIYAKTGLITYYGPNFKGFGARRGGDYTIDHAVRCLMDTAHFQIDQSKTWYEKDYNTKKTTYKKFRGKGRWVINTGIAQGRLVGGEISTILLLCGTKYLPNLKDRVLFLEMYKGDLLSFDRMLESLLSQPGGEKLEGLMIGRFQKEAKIKKSDLAKVIHAKPKLHGVPVVANLDIGHTYPQATVPIGGLATINITKGRASIKIGEH